MVTAVISGTFHGGDSFTIPLGNGNGIDLIYLERIPHRSRYFTLRQDFFPVRLFPDMIRALNERKQEEGYLSPIQTFVCVHSDPSRNGKPRESLCDLAGGARLRSDVVIGSDCTSTAFVEALAQLYMKRTRSTAVTNMVRLTYIHSWRGSGEKETETPVIAVPFALVLPGSAKISWVISNSVVGI